jgi:hypothetical protein
MRFAAKSFLATALAFNVAYLLVALWFGGFGPIGVAIAAGVIVWNIVAMVPLRQAPRFPPRTHDSLGL